MWLVSFASSVDKLNVTRSDGKCQAAASIDLLISTALKRWKTAETNVIYTVAIKPR